MSTTPTLAKTKTPNGVLGVALERLAPYLDDFPFLMFVATDYKGAEANLRRSEIAEWNERYYQIFMENLKLPEDIVLVPHEQTSRSGDHFRIVDIKGKDISQSPQNFQKKWGDIISEAVNKTRAITVEKLGDPPVHDQAGNVISGAHAARAGAERSTTKGLSY